MSEPDVEVVPLTGSEPFDGLDATVLDFWRWAMSDLRVNNVRGYVAEFLVARAVGATGLRIEWDSHDVTAPDGTRIEVKTSGGIQAWELANPSKPKWSGLRARIWMPTDGYSTEPSYNADVYVFCHHTARLGRIIALSTPASGTSTSCHRLRSRRPGGSRCSCPR